MNDQRGLVAVDRDAERGVAVVTLDRPDALNALSVALRTAVCDALATLAVDDTIGAIVLTGAGRAFSAGVDLKELSGGTAPRPDPARRTIAGREMRGDNIVAAIGACPVPVIAAVNGVAITGGFELVLACDVIYVSTEARFADTHARLGIMPGWGMTGRLPRLIGLPRAKELSLSGNYLDAATAERWGLVNRVFEPDALLGAATQLAADMASCDRRAVKALKASYDAGFASTLTEALAIEKQAGRDVMSGVGATDIAARRDAVQARGRQQSGG